MFLNNSEENSNMLFYLVESFENVDKFTIEMLNANPIPEVIRIGIKDDKLLLPISKLVPLEEYLKENADTEGLEEKLRDQYEQTVEKLENYMIPKEELILNFFYSFVDPDEDSLVLPVVPTDFAFLESHSVFEFSSCVHCTIENEKKDVLSEKPKKKEKVKKVKPKRENKFFEKIVRALESSGKDDLFDFPVDGALPEGVHVIVVRSTGAEYPLMFGPDLVGRDENKCSIAFPGNGAMEAEHCSITLARGKYYLADLNSGSGTLLNGVKIEPGKTYELSSADLITVAGEELVFSKRI